jgi:electron-transferring-flavoprotein dehydrogenase
LVVGLDYRDARFSAHDAFQQLKTHPFIKKLLEGGKRVGWGAKTIPSGGYWAMPERLWAPGLVLAGDGAAMCNVSELKGIHYAMHAGMFAAEAIVEQLKSGSTEDLSNYADTVRRSEIQKDLYRTRNMRQPASKAGFFIGSAIGSMMILTGGRFPGGRWPTHDDATVDVFIGKERSYPKPDGKLTFDKLSSVFASGNATRDDAPDHIRIQERVPLELALMWQNKCPAQVYEVPDEELAAASADGEREVELQVTPSNCIQCGAITAKGGRLTPPEGGDGPNYQAT